LATFAALAATWSAAAAAYQAVAVENGGRIAVLVTHAGASQVIREPAARDAEFCGTAIESRVTEIGATGGVKNAIVAIDAIERGKAPDTTAVARLDNLGCHFVPRVQTVTAGQTLEITNSDPILHSTHAKNGKRTVFNLALATKGQKVLKPIREPGRLNIRCDAGHTWMNAWIVSFPHPYHAVSAERPSSFTSPSWPPSHRRPEPRRPLRPRSVEHGRNHATTRRDPAA
jgi:hypothetical protein